MIAAALMTIGAACAGPGPTVAAATPADSLRALYEGGRTWSEFYEAISTRTRMWRNNYTRGSIEETALARARALTGTWRVLVIAVDGCSDSANTIPYLASLVDSAGGAIAFRIIDTKQGRAIMEAHLTRDGRAATPTLILLDEEWNEVGCWVERPSELARWGERERGKLSDRRFLREKLSWYDEDGGRSTIAEILDMIDRAAPGASCGGGA